MNQHITFSGLSSVTHMVSMLDAYKFKPKGRGQWLQRIAWRFLQWCGAMDQAYEPTTTYTRHEVKADKFMEQIYKQRRFLFDQFDREPKRLLIGAEDYADLMSSPEMSTNHFRFESRYSHGHELMGLKVEVIPWMRGALVMPASSMN